MLGFTESVLASFAIKALESGVNTLEHYALNGVSIDQGHLIALRSLVVRAARVFEKYAEKSVLEPHERKPILAAAAGDNAAGQQQPAESNPAAAAAAGANLGSAAATGSDEPGKPAA